jgi:hypothetical protein
MTTHSSTPTARLKESIDGADTTLTATERLLAQFRRSIKEKIALRQPCPHPGFCEAAGHSYYLEGDGIWLEPQPCPHCDGFRLVRSQEVSRAA